MSKVEFSAIKKPSVFQNYLRRYIAYKIKKKTCVWYLD